MTFLQAPALPEELDGLMRRMRLPYMRKTAPDVLATARAQRWDPAEVLRLLIAEEVTGRDAATRRLRRHSANFPTGKTLAPRNTTGHKHGFLMVTSLDTQRPPWASQ